MNQRHYDIYVESVWNCASSKACSTVYLLDRASGCTGMMTSLTFGKDDTDYVVCGETVSQYTGFQDRSDNPIFENDILSVETTSDNGVEKREYIVYFGKSGQWYTVSNDADRDNVLLSTLLHKRAIFLKVTGNTFDEAEKMAHEFFGQA